MKTCIEPFIVLLSQADLLTIFLFLYEIIGGSLKIGEVGVDFESNGIL